jgi:hypothetical protein
MGKCDICGKSKLFLKKTNCFFCGKDGCSDCHTHLLTISFGDSFSKGFEKIKLFICNSNCKEHFTNLVKQQIEKTTIDLNKRVNVLRYLELVFDLNEFHFDEKIMKDLIDYPFEPNHNGFYHIYDYVEKTFFEIIYKTALTKKAQMLLQVRRLEEAARVFEHLGMYEEAGKARADNKQILIKKTEVTVDLNSLLKQIKTGGFVVVYRCPNCGAPLKVNKESNMQSIRTCKHCNFEIESMDVADFLRTALS